MPTKPQHNPKRFLIRHIGNMGDLVFFIPPVLETLKKKYPNCHITLVTAWGYKETVRKIPTFEKKEYWGTRNQSGFSIHLMMTNPNIDRLVHYHDTKLSLTKTICYEDGESFETWSKAYYEKQKRRGKYAGVYELDLGIKHTDNPIERMYREIELPSEHYSNYQLYATDHDKQIAKQIMKGFPRPRIVLLEGMEGTTTRGWDPAKIKQLETALEKKYKTKPIWFGGRYTQYHEGRPLTLRENIATLLYCDLAIGVLSGPLHFAASLGLPTITLYADQEMHRAAPAFFLNKYIKSKKRQHRTILAPTNPNNMKFLKDGSTKINLTPVEWRTQNYLRWQNPGRQSTKSSLAAITTDEVMTVINDMLA